MLISVWAVVGSFEGMVALGLIAFRGGGSVRAILSCCVPSWK